MIKTFKNCKESRNTAKLPGDCTVIKQNVNSPVEEMEMEILFRDISYS